MERWFSTDYSTTVCRNLMIRSADPAWNFNFDRIKEKKCDKGGKNESLFFLQIFIKGVQTLRMDLRPVHVRDGHHDVVSRPDNLDFLCSRFQHPMCLNLKTLLRIALVRCCQILSSFLHGAHITRCLAHSAQFLWYHLMRSMRSSTHVNCLLYGEQLFTNSGPTSTWWLLYYLN